MPSARFLEYTDDETSARFSELNEDLIEELKEFPALFMCENEASPSFIGKISKLRFRSNEIVIHFERIQDIPDLPEGEINGVRAQFSLILETIGIRPHLFRWLAQ